MCHKMVKNCHHLFRRYCEEDYKQFHLLVQTWRHPTEQAYHDKIWLIALYLSWIPFIFYQTLWYLYFWPKLNLSILWLNPWSTRVLTASTPCSSASSICPDSYYQLKFLTVLKEKKKKNSDKQGMHLRCVCSHLSKQLYWDWGSD